ncbi:Aromatic/aminoadipate aminotransferase 1 [Ascosphaera pollenicola]|nr:Aromatic/aminoadipate aminotransferase 1 [Ascosphaera pollenicola]
MSPAADPLESAQERLTVANVALNRSRTPLPTALVAASHSDMFKSPACFKKPKGKEWREYFTSEAASREQPKLKSIAQLMKNPGMISLAGGLPSSTYFPFESISISNPAAPDFTELHHSTATKHDIADQTSPLDLEVVLNYGHAFGTPPLVRFVTEHTEIAHNPPYSNWSCTLTVGSTSSWDTTLRLFCERGDYVLYEEFTFSSAREAATPMGVHPLGVKMDADGPLPAALDDIMTHWDEKARGARKPCVFYTIPTGHNPTGITHSPERRRAIYAMCQKHDLLLIEDEPYYFLQMEKYKGGGQSEHKTYTSHEEFIASLVPSYLSMDVDGRVIRFDSFSKIIAPGSRVGWITAPDEITTTFCRQAESSIQSPSGISQIALHKLFEDWDHAGFFDWLMHIQKSYTKRRDTLTHACEKFLPAEIASWVVPQAGMFQWIKVDWAKHPGVKEGKTHAEIEQSIFDAVVSEGSLVALGSWFLADTTQAENDMFFRVTFASAPPEKIEEAIRRFGVALKKVFQV